MPLDFPASPTNGQAYQGYIYNAANETWDSAFAPRAATIPISSSNVIINGAFDIWQRGTSIAIAGGSSGYTADRWMAWTGPSLAATVSRQTSGVVGTRYCARVQRNSGNTAVTDLVFSQPFESADSILYAGQTVTLSFYARAGANFSSSGSALTIYLAYGTGTDQNMYVGFTGQSNMIFQTPTLTTSWQRFSYSVAVPSNATQIGFAAKYSTVGTAGANDYFEITGVQLEVGAAATDFRRNAPSIAGELAACQRYYARIFAEQINAHIGLAHKVSSNLMDMMVNLPVPMRATPTSADWNFSGVVFYGPNQNFAAATISRPTDASSRHIGVVRNQISGTLTDGTFIAYAESPGTAYVGFSAEL